MFINYNDLTSYNRAETKWVDLHDVINSVEPRAVQVENQIWELKVQIAELKKELSNFLSHPDGHILAFYLDEAERYDPETSEFHRDHMETVDYRDEFSGWNDE